MLSNPREENVWRIDRGVLLQFTNAPEYGDSNYPLGYAELWNDGMWHIVSAAPDKQMTITLRMLRVTRSNDAFDSSLVVFPQHCELHCCVCDCILHTEGSQFGVQDNCTHQRPDTGVPMMNAIGAWTGPGRDLDARKAMEP